MERALQIAATSTMSQRHGCVISHNGKVLSVGVNATRNDPRVCSDPETESAYHAEIAAIRALPPDTDFTRLTLYSARLSKRNVPALAAPCLRCEAVIRRLGFKEVFHT